MNTRRSKLLASAITCLVLLPGCSGNYISPREYQRATEICAPNQGLKHLRIIARDRNARTKIDGQCNNGLQFEAWVEP